MEVFLKFLMDFQPLMVVLLSALLTVIGALFTGIVILIWKASHWKTTTDQGISNIKTDISDVKTDIDKLERSLSNQITDVKSEIKDLSKSVDSKIDKVDSKIDKVDSKIDDLPTKLHSIINLGERVAHAKETRKFATEASQKKEPVLK